MNEIELRVKSSVFQLFIFCVQKNVPIQQNNFQFVSVLTVRNINFIYIPMFYWKSATKTMIFFQQHDPHRFYPIIGSKVLYEKIIFH